MQVYDRSQVSGRNVDLVTTNDRHFQADGTTGIKGKSPEETFSKVLFNWVQEVDKSQQTADVLEEQMVLNPESVNVHEVMIASEKARLSVSLFKSITEKAIRAYNDIMMIR